MGGNINIQTLHGLSISNIKSDIKKVKIENEEKMDSQICNERNILNVKNSDIVSSFKIVPHHTVSTESMSTSCLLYRLSKL